MYFDSMEAKFKTRHYNHKTGFKLAMHKNNTKLARDIWKKSGADYSQKKDKSPSKHIDR